MTVSLRLSFPERTHSFLHSFWHCSHILCLHCSNVHKRLGESMTRTLAFLDRFSSFRKDHCHVASQPSFLYRHKCAQVAQALPGWRVLHIRETLAWHHVWRASALTLSGNRASTRNVTLWWKIKCKASAACPPKEICPLNGAFHLLFLEFNLGSHSIASILKWSLYIIMIVTAFGVPVVCLMLLFCVLVKLSPNFDRPPM